MIQNLIKNDTKKKKKEREREREMEKKRDSDVVSAPCRAQAVVKRKLCLSYDTLYTHDEEGIERARFGGTHRHRQAGVLNRSPTVLHCHIANAPVFFSLFASVQSESAST